MNLEQYKNIKRLYILKALLLTLQVSDIITINNFTFIDINMKKIITDYIDKELANGV